MRHNLPWPVLPPSRRRFLGAGLAFLGSGAAVLQPPPIRAAQTVTLCKLAAEKGLIYGTTIAAAQITGDGPFVDLVRQEAGLVVAENEMKWQVMNRGAPVDDDYGPADTIANFAAVNSLVLRGHNLLWYYRTPDWFFELPDQSSQERAVIDHIRQLAGRYRGRIHSWDVVNEPIEPKDGRPDGLRTAVFLDKIGPDYIDLAHHAARQADLDARFVVNEYGVELGSVEHEAHRTAVLDLIQRLQLSGTPIDAVGIQAHFSCADGQPFCASRLRLAEIRGLGSSIQITELDLNDRNAPADETLPDGLDTYSRFLDVALDEPAVKMVMTRGLSDRHSRLAKSRSDQVPSRPLPFDADLEPKQAFEAVASAFAHAPQRNRWGYPTVGYGWGAGSRVISGIIGDPSCL